MFHPLPGLLLPGRLIIPGLRPESRRPGTGLTSTVTGVVPPPTEPRVINGGSSPRVSHPDGFMVISVKSGRSFVPRNRGPQRHWGLSGWSLCPACPAQPQSTSLCRGRRHGSLRRTPRALRQGPGSQSSLPRGHPVGGSLAWTARPCRILSPVPAPPCSLQ